MFSNVSLLGWRGTQSTDHDAYHACYLVPCSHDSQHWEQFYCYQQDSLRILTATDISTGLPATYPSEPFCIDMDGISRELIDSQKRDAELIRQEFIRNGIDSPVTLRNALNGNQNLRSIDSFQICHEKFCSPPSNEYDPNAIIGKAAGRRKKWQKENEAYCVFCFNNGETDEIYLSHACRDENGFVTCPILKKYVCPYCKATDKFAHTKKYCPKKPIITPEDLEKMEICRQKEEREWPRNSRGRRALRF